MTFNVSSHVSHRQLRSIHVASRRTESLLSYLISVLQEMLFYGDKFTFAFNARSYRSCIFFLRLNRTEYGNYNFRFVLSCVFNWNNRWLKIVF
jgi:hypothetical protein